MTKMEIQRSFFLGEITLEEANKASEKYRTSVPEHLILTDKERAATTVGDTPEYVTGYGIMQNGAGWPDKTYIQNGKFKMDTGFVKEQGFHVWIGGKEFTVDGDHIVE